MKKENVKYVGADPVSAHTSKARQNRGITLMALIITVILMLILASITINVAINGGLFNYASDAKNSTEIASEKETVQKATILAESTSKTGRITVEEMQKAINSITEENAATAIDALDTIIVKFKSDRCYEIDSKGNVEYVGKLKEKTLTLQCTDSTGKIVGEKTYIVLKNKYSIIPPEIEGYESAVEKIEGEINENKTISQLYYMIFDDDTTLVFTGLDENGNVTTDEASIVSYMIGDGSTTAGNGLLEKTVQGVLKIPATYKEKPVKQVGDNSFKNTSNMIKADTGDGAEKILVYAFWGSSITQLTIGKSVNNIHMFAFSYCSQLKKVIFKNSLSSYNAPFGQCTNWTEIEVDSEEYSVRDNILYSKDGKTLILVPIGRTGKLIIPEDTQNIAENAFRGSNLSSVEILDNITKINNGTFMNMSQLCEITIGENIKSIPVNCFQNATKLTTVIINSSDIAKTESSSLGRMMDNANTVYIRDDIVEVANYITSDYLIVESDKEGYVKYVKN